MSSFKQESLDQKEFIILPEMRQQGHKWLQQGNFFNYLSVALSFCLFCLSVSLSFCLSVFLSLCPDKVLTTVSTVQQLNIRVETLEVFKIANAGIAHSICSANYSSTISTIFGAFFNKKCLKIRLG